MIAVPFGCIVSGIVTQPVGRKRAMQLVNLPFLAAWLLFSFSTEVWHIFCALAITGASGGLLEAPVSHPRIQFVFFFLSLKSFNNVNSKGSMMVHVYLATVVYQELKLSNLRICKRRYR